VRAEEVAQWYSKDLGLILNTTGGKKKSDCPEKQCRVTKGKQSKNPNTSSLRDKQMERG
jgi:hypothetical protein